MSWAVRGTDGAPQAAARKVPARENSENVADQSLLGRSPSQRFTSANHLLNFQPRYGQSQVGQSTSMVLVDTPERVTWHPGPCRNQPRSWDMETSKFKSRVVG
jgi:hypothetical protein